MAWIASWLSKLNRTVLEICLRGNELPTAYEQRLKERVVPVLVKWFASAGLRVACHLATCDLSSGLRSSRVSSPTSPAAGQREKKITSKPRDIREGILI